VKDVFDAADGPRPGVAERPESSSACAPQVCKEILDCADRAFVKDGKRCWFVPVCDIAVFESEGNHSRAYCNGQRLLVPRSLNYLESRLSPFIFFRANRKHIVNVRSITNVEVDSTGKLLLRMHDGIHISMSRRRARRFRTIMTF
jgi:two-component system LytT family response regulator